MTDSNVGFLPSGFVSRSALTKRQVGETFRHFSAYFQRPTVHPFFTPWIQMLEGLELGGVPQSWFGGENDGGICAVDLVKCPTVKNWGGFVSNKANRSDKELIYLKCFEDAGPGQFLKRQIGLHKPTVAIFADTASYLSENRLPNKDTHLFRLWPKDLTEYRAGIWSFRSPWRLSIGLGAVKEIRTASPALLKKIKDAIQATIRAWEDRIASATAV